MYKRLSMCWLLLEGGHTLKLHYPLVSPTFRSPPQIQDTLMERESYLIIPDLLLNIFPVKPSFLTISIKKVTPSLKTEDIGKYNIDIYFLLIRIILERLSN